MNLIEGSNVDDNFWEQNPYLKYISPFSDLYKSDRTKGKEFSSVQMWAVFFREDATDKNKYNRIPLDERIPEIEYFIKEKGFEKKFNWEDVQKAIDMYAERALSPAQRNFKAWLDKMNERSKFLRETPYDVDTFDMLEKMLIKNKVLWDDYERVNKQMIDEESKSTLKGGRRETKAEQGLI